MTSSDVIMGHGRNLDPLKDPELVRLVGLNLELAIKNLISSGKPPENMVITADICTHRIVVFADPNGQVRVVVCEN